MIPFILLIFGFILLVFGANKFVDGSSSLAYSFKIPPIIIGLTIAAIGTSVPEAFVSTIAAIQGNSDIAASNVLGSNILNILLILGITAFIKPLNIKQNTIKKEIPFLFLISLVMLLMGIDGIISRTDGLILLLFMIIFINYLFEISKEDNNQEEIKQYSIIKSLIFTIIGLVCIIFGSKFTVDNAVIIAKNIGISEKIIGLTIVSIGTSLPELVTSIVAALKGQNDIAVGNILGSNIFNILFVLGIASSISSVNFNLISDTIISIGITFILFIFSINDKKISKVEGFIFISLYAIYIFYIL